MPVARIIANRLNFESDRLIQELTYGRMMKNECKAFLDAVIRDERARIERVRLVSKMDPSEGDDQVDQRHDRLTAEAWRMLEERGIDVRLTQHDVTRLAATGADPNLYDDLPDRIDLLARSIISEAGTARMIAQARQSIDHAVGADNLLSKIVTAIDILKLREILISGKAVAWNETSPKVALRDDDALDRTTGCEPQPKVSIGISTEAAPSSLPAGDDPRFSIEPNITAVAQRVNASKARQHCKPETQRQILATAALFSKATDITEVTRIEQRHLSYFVGLLHKLPTSYGKSSKDAERTIGDILARAESLPEEQVGLSPRTINGHLDRLNLLIETAQSEGLDVSRTIKIDLLRVPETKRARDKRAPFEPHHIRRIFEHPIWTGCQSSVRRHQPGHLIQKDAFFWGPLLAAYSGARREEILGLAPEDIETIDGVPCMSIKPNANRGLKNDGSKRIIPLHDHLLALGFLEYSRELQARKEQALFPELRPTNKSDSFGDKFFFHLGPCT